MKKLFGILALFVLFAIMPANAQEGTLGIIYKNAVEPGIGFTGAQAVKKGEAVCTSYFAIVGLGQCGINDAAKAGKIKTIAYYDIQTRNILGFKKVKTTVYGQ